MKSIGLEITPSGVAVTQLSADRTSYSILNGHFFPLNAADTDNWEIDLLQALKEIREMYNFENSTVCVAISQSSASTRNINFPFSRRLDIIKSLPFELEEELPFGADDAIFDAKTVATNANETSVLAFAVRSEDVQKVLDVLARVQIEPDILTVEGSAYANLYENWGSGSFLQSAPESIPAPLHMRFFFRHESTLVALFRDRQLVFVRSIAWGERNLVFELMRQYNYPYDQAESIIPDHTKLLLTVAGASADEIRMSDVVEKTFRPFVHELRLMFIEIQDRFQSQIESASVSGRMGNIENINALLTRYFGIPFNTERIDGEVFSSYQVAPIASAVEKLTIAVGTAIEGFKRPRNPAINLRQGEFAKRNLFLEKAWAKWSHAIILAAIIYTGLIVYGFVREQIATQLDDMAFAQLQKSAKQIANIPEQRVSPENVQAYLDEESQKQKNLKVFEQVQDIEPAMKVVEALSQELPLSKDKGYDIRKVDVKYATVTIEGESRQPHTVNLIRQKLEGLSVNKKVEKISPTVKGTGGTMFAFRVRIKG